MKTALVLWITSMSCLFLAGCASDPYVPTIRAIDGAILGREVSKDDDTDLPRVVVIRFPAGIDPDPGALSSLRKAYNDNKYSGTGQRKQSGETALDEAVAKTSYYALKFYDALVASNADIRFVLQPATIKFADGKATLVEIVQAPTCSALIDFFTYVDPFWSLGTLNQPDTTFGKNIVPVLTIRTLPAVSPKTNGYVAGMHGLLGVTSPGNGPEATAWSASGATIVELMNLGRQQAAKNNFEGSWYDLSVTTRPWQANSHIRLPVIHSEVATDNKDHELSPSGIVPFTNLILRDILTLLPKSSPAGTLLFRQYASYYDSNISMRTEVDELRRSALLKMAQAEATFCSKQSEAVARVLLNGEWAASFREARVKESQQVSKANTKAWASLAVAAVLMNPALTMLIGQTVANSMNTHAAQLEESFQAVRSEQITVGVKIFEDDSSISASTYEELRTKLRELYIKRFPELPASNAVARK